MGKYRELNEILDNYLKENENRLYIRNIGAILDLLLSSKKLINPFKELDTKCIDNDCEEKVDGITIISLVREFLSTIDDEYVRKFDESIKNGAFGFCDIKNEIPEIKIDLSGKEDGFYYYNVGFEGNLYAGKLMVHEFFHYLSLSPVSNYSITRDFLTEMVSIYMENKFLDFMSTKDFNRNDINNIKLERYIMTYKNLSPLYYETLALNIKLKLGYLDEETYLLLQDYYDELYAPKVTYEEYLSTLDKFKNNINEDDFDPAYAGRYFIGTIFASYLLENEDKNTIHKVARLNENINNEELKFVDALDEIGLPLNEIEPDKLIWVANYHYEKIIKRYKNNKIKRR